MNPRKNDTPYTEGQLEALQGLNERGIHLVKLSDSNARRPVNKGWLANRDEFEPEHRGFWGWVPGRDGYVCIDIDKDVDNAVPAVRSRLGEYAFYDVESSPGSGKRHFFCERPNTPDPVPNTRIGLNGIKVGDTRCDNGQIRIVDPEGLLNALEEHEFATEPLPIGILQNLWGKVASTQTYNRPSTPSNEAISAGREYLEVISRGNHAEDALDAMAALRIGIPEPEVKKWFLDGKPHGECSDPSNCRHTNGRWDRLVEGAQASAGVGLRRLWTRAGCPQIMTPEAREAAGRIVQHDDEMDDIPEDEWERWRDAWYRWETQDDGPRPGSPPPTSCGLQVVYPSAWKVVLSNPDDGKFGPLDDLDNEPPVAEGGAMSWLAYVHDYNKPEQGPLWRCRRRETREGQWTTTWFEWHEGTGWLKVPDTRIGREAAREVEGVLRKISVSGAVKHDYVSPNKVPFYRALTSLMADHAPWQTPQDEWDRDHYLLGHSDGTVTDLRTGKRRQQHPQDLITRTTMPPATTAGWDTIAEQAMLYLFPEPDLLEEFLTSISESAIGGQLLERVNLLSGESGTGKSLLMELLLDAMGSYAMMMVDAQMTEKGHDPYAGSSKDAQAEGIRFGLLPDIKRSSGPLDQGAMRQAVGNRKRAARAIGQNAQDIEMSLTPVIVGNDIHGIGQVDYAGDRRGILFKSRAPGRSADEQDIKLKALAMEDGSREALLRHVIDRAVNLLRRGVPPISPRVSRDTQNWRLRSDDIARTLATYMEPDPKGRVFTSDIAAVISRDTDCEVKPESVSKQLRNRGFKVKRTKIDMRTASALHGYSWTKSLEDESPEAGE